MAKPAKRKVPGGQRSAGGRVTPKGTRPEGYRNPDLADRLHDEALSVQGPSPRWVPILMFALFGVGTLTILANYLSLLPGAASNWYLLVGLGFILGGIITATQYR